MKGNWFVDTNLLVYYRDRTEPDKQTRAAQWLGGLWHGRNGRLSTQVLSEYYVTVTQKLRPGLPSDAAWADVKALMAWRPVSLDGALLERARGLQQRYQLAWWDALIVAAAHRSTCTVLLTEDLQDGQDFDGVTVRNPFLHMPESGG
jgi:predicted nucleic acid-binding protein